MHAHIQAHHTHKMKPKKKKKPAMTNTPTQHPLVYLWMCQKITEYSRESDIKGSYLSFCSHQCTYLLITRWYWSLDNHMISTEDNLTLVLPSHRKHSLWKQGHYTVIKEIAVYKISRLQWSTLKNCILEKWKSSLSKRVQKLLFKGLISGNKRTKY